jgi:hypothetical protein
MLSRHSGDTQMTLLGTVRRLTTCALAASLLVWSVCPSGAENGQIAAGIAGGLIGGALIGGALASRPVYAPPPPPAYYYAAPVVVDAPVCRIVRDSYWDGYGYRIREVRICD